MRINVYSQELVTDGRMPYPKVVEAVEQTSNTGLVYSAVRLFLHSSDRLHQPPGEDDDRSAITFWLPQSEKRREYLARTFESLAIMVREAKPETGLD